MGRRKRDNICLQDLDLGATSLGIGEDKVEVTFPTGEVGIIRGDGTIWCKEEAYGAIALVPMPDKEIMSAITGTVEGVESNSTLMSMPDIGYMVPRHYLLEWATILAQYSIEAAVVYGVNKTDPEDWIAVVPTQENTTGSFDVPDFGGVLQLFSDMGYSRVGTIHTHPGDFLECSGIDTGEIWDKFGGIHIIVTHRGRVSFWFSNSGKTWRLSNPWSIRRLWNGNPKDLNNDLTADSLYNEDGGADIDRFITKEQPALSKHIGRIMGFSSGATRNKNWLYNGVIISGKRVYHQQKEGVLVSEEYGKHYPFYWSPEVGGLVAGERMRTTKPVIYTGKAQDINTPSFGERLTRVCREAKILDLYDDPVGVVDFRIAYVGMISLLKKVEEAYSEMVKDKRYEKLMPELSELALTLPYVYNVLTGEDRVKSLERIMDRYFIDVDSEV